MLFEVKMANLQDLIPSKKTVLGVDVYPLTLQDLSSLIKDHRDAIIALFSNQNMDQIITNFPRFIASLIAKGTKSTPEIAIQVPAGKQLEIIVGIWEVSQINVELLGKVLGGITKNMETMSKPLRNGKAL